MTFNKEWLPIAFWFIIASACFSVPLLLHMNLLREVKELQESTIDIIRFIEEKKNPFEATGYIVTRLDDGRFLISFSRPENYMGRDRLLTYDVTLSPSDFNAFVSVLIPTTPKKEEENQNEDRGDRGSYRSFFAKLFERWG